MSKRIIARRTQSEPESFEIWNTATRNLYGSFGSRREAMRAAFELVEAHGSQFVAELVLASENARGETTRIAAGAELEQLARSEG